MALRGQVRDEVIPAVEVPTPVEEVHAQDAMRMALRHKRAFLERCFDQELKKRAIFNGFVVLKVSVAVDGKVTDTQVLEGNSRDRAVGHCMAAHLRTVRLPALSAEADLILPIRLEAKAPNWAEARASLD